MNLILSRNAKKLSATINNMHTYIYIHTDFSLFILFIPNSDLKLR